MRGPQSYENEIPSLGENHFLYENQRRCVLFDTFVGETRVVAHTGESGGGAAHGTDVKAVLDPPDKGFAESGASARNLVKVRAPRGVMAGVETVVSTTHVKYVDVRRQKIVEPVEEPLIGKCRRRLQMCNLPDRVHTGVRAPGSLDVDGDAEQLARGPQQITLNGAGILLPLPSMVACSLILDVETVAHGRKNT